MIWDTFLFAGELDMLECRLRTLAHLDIRFVIAEAAWTFQGNPRPLSRPAQRARFARWAGQIIYVPSAAGPYVGHLPAANQAWALEGWQRGALHRALDPARDDLILHGDVDEIPDPVTLAKLEAGEPRALEMRTNTFAVDWERPELDANTVVLSPASLHPDGGTLLDYRQAARNLPRIPDGGRHLSWLGGPAAIRAKARAFSHAELTGVMDANAERCYETGWCPWDGVQQMAADVDETWPAWIAGRECPASWFRPR